MSLQENIKHLDVYRPVPLARQVVLCRDCRHCKGPNEGWGARCDINVKEVCYVDGRRTLHFCTEVNNNGECGDFEPKILSEKALAKKRVLSLSRQKDELHIFLAGTILGLVVCLMVEILISRVIL